MMENKRDGARSASYARVFLTEQGIVGHLRDLSAEGCRMSFLAPGPDLQAGREIDVVIVPVEGLGVARIATNFLPRWIRSDGPAVQTGGILTRIPREFRDAYRQLLAYFSQKTTEE